MALCSTRLWYRSSRRRAQCSVHFCHGSAGGLDEPVELNVEVVAGGVEAAARISVALRDVPQSTIGVRGRLPDGCGCLGYRRRAFQHHHAGGPHQGVERIAQGRAELMDAGELLGGIGELGGNVTEPVVQLAGNMGLFQEVKVRCPADLPDLAAVPGQRRGFRVDSRSPGIARLVTQLASTAVPPVSAATSNTPSTMLKV